MLFISVAVICSPTFAQTASDAESVDTGAGTREADESHEPDTDALAEAYLSELETQVAQRVTSEFLRDEIDRLESVGGFGADDSLADRLVEAPSATRSAARMLQKRNYAPYFRSLQNARETVHEDVRSARADLLEARRHLSDLQVDKLEATAHSKVTAQIAGLFNQDNVWIWLCALLGGLMLASAYAIAHRHYLRRLALVRRRRFWKRVALLGLVVLVPLVPVAAILITGNRTYEALLAAGDSPSEVVTSEIQQKIDGISEESARDGLRERLERNQKRHDQAMDQWVSSLPVEFKEKNRELVQAWQESRHALLSIAVDLALLDEFASRVENVAGETERLESEVGVLESRLAARADSRRWTSAFLGGGLFLGYGGLGLVFVARERSRARKTRKKCPRCGAVGFLSEDEEGSSRGKEYRCTHVIREDAQEECEFIINEAYLSRQKIMFPTLGITYSGKTHWLVMVYHDLNRGRTPDKVHFNKIKGNAAEQMDELVDGILNHRMQVPGTQTASLPHPLLFDFADNDRLQRSNVLITVSDYAGEVYERDDHAFREQLLKSDGYFVFLDPTKGSEMQVSSLNDFQQDLQLHRRIPPGRTIHSPVALCVSKLDLMVNESYARNSDIVQQFYRELAEVDANTEQLTLNRIQRRSDVVARLSGIVWPGWEIEKKIRGVFGERFMFFPLTPVGLDRPGEPIEDRNIEPYAIVEPLLWLLHMNGYPALD